jgi:hypothetical protein
MTKKEEKDGGGPWMSPGLAVSCQKWALGQGGNNAPGSSGNNGYEQHHKGH